MKTAIFLITVIIISEFLFIPAQNQIEVTYKQPSPFLYPEGGAPPGRVWKEVYGVDAEGKIVLIKKVEGLLFPERYEKVPESINWLLVEEVE